MTLRLRTASGGGSLPGAQDFHRTLEQPFKFTGFDTGLQQGSPLVRRGISRNLILGCWIDFFSIHWRTTPHQD